MPKGAKIDVYFNPGDPGESVLVRGLEGSDLFIWMFLTPFNLVLAAGIREIVRNFRRQDPEPEEVSILDEGDRLRIELPRLAPITAAGLTLLSLTFGGVFVIGFTTGFHPSFWTMVIVWNLLLGLSWASYVNKERRIAVLY